MFVFVSRRGIERHLMRGCIKEVRIVKKHILSAVAVMHVEIDDGDSPKSALFARMHRTDGNIVEQTKSHRPPTLGVMSRRANGTKGVVVLACHDAIHSLDHRSGCVQRRIG